MLKCTLQAIVQGESFYSEPPQSKRPSKVSTRPLTLAIAASWQIRAEIYRIIKVKDGLQQKSVKLVC